MPHAKERMAGWRGAVLVAVTYIYFLIFAQFGFLARLASLGIADQPLKAVLAAMALGGAALSLAMPRLRRWNLPDARLRAGLIVCAAAALLSLLPLDVAGATAVSLAIGAGLGVVTVTLATHLRRWTGSGDALWMAGLGTGVGYLVCNAPALFNAPARVQALTAALLCLAGAAITLLPAQPAAEPRPASRRDGLPFGYALGCFAALVWLDSAAFFIIQHTPFLKAGTWAGALHLSADGLLHLAAALAAVWLLRRRGLPLVLGAAFAALGGACLLLLDAERIALASALYPVGVSLYSVALVAYPSVLAPAATAAERGRRAGWVYAVAGWAGSAMGIGMAQNLGHVPPGFVLAAGVVVLGPWLARLLARRRREATLTAAVMLAAFCVDRMLPGEKAEAPQSAVERGRQVYIAEGCIHCHSQYVRPGSPDVTMWGPATNLEALRRQQPPLIGNRRQGPDLSAVGGRRSPLWLKAHFYDPAEVSGSSIMPSFAFLFSDRRGDDLVAYLASLHSAGTAQHLAEERLWRPSSAAVAQASAAEGERLFLRNCATCHAGNGRTRQRWRTEFKGLPPNLSDRPFAYLPPHESPEEDLIRLEQIVKFGIYRTDMPGHEYLPDEQVVSLSLWLTQMKAQPLENR